MSKLQENNVVNEQVYTVEEIAKLARISRTGAYELIKKEYFPVIRVGTGHAQPDMVMLTFWMRTARSMPSALRQAFIPEQICAG